MSFIPAVVTFFVTLVIVAPITWVVSSKAINKSNDEKIGNANERAREIIDEALKAAETKKKEALLEVKEESLKTKNELEKETKERRAEIQKYEKRVLSKEETLDRKIEAVEKRDLGITRKEEELGKQRQKVDELEKKRQQELERISGLTSEQAKEYLLKTVEDEVKHDTAVMIKTLESRAKEEADKKAKEIVVNAIQRCAADHVAETTISVVQLPNDEMKGRIIGREGRNIRTLETLTGVELIIDDTPEAVILSGFDPIRREVARIALEKLIVDGRIHPARIEEMVEKAQKEVETLIKEEGEAATLEVGVHGIHPELVRLLDGMTRSSLLALVRFDGAGKLLDSDYCIGEALKAAVAVLPGNRVTAFNSDGQFWIYVPRFGGKPEEFADNIRKAVKECCLPDEFGVRSSSNHSLSVTAGISSGFEVPARLMHAAGFALYEAKAKGAGSICCFDPEKYAKQKSDIESIRAFSELLDKNLFTYHFQPIVSSSTGEIVAYEALMRTKGNIALNPLQILNCAKNFGRLYDIEKATLKNTLKYLSKHQLDFENRRLYINSISSHALDDKDFYAIVNDYGELLEKVVIEMTEQTEISEDDLDRIRVRLEKNNMSLAIDDYGTGYSNTSNLLRYDPEVVKIDRSLISGIDQNPKAQKIVSKMVEYFHSSGYTALAEGVETSEELKTMIYFGVDLIQGYYVSKPKPVLIHDISENIREEIVAYSIEAGDKDKKVFHAEDNDVIDLAEMYKKDILTFFSAQVHLLFQERLRTIVQCLCL